jgi:hypothetical protein
MVSSLSEVRVHDAIGVEEKVYDTAGLSFDKAPYDWFRGLLRLGAGDLRVRLAGGHVIDSPNVVHLDRRLDAIEEQLRTNDVD